ncbi:MAG: lysine transporter LysE [Nocardioides sp.]|nr:lysine transporter LysE [Nocardioides sp.]
MPTTAQLLAFVVASALFLQVPGPSLLFMLGRALTVGHREALLSVLGNSVGVAVQAVLAAVGLGALVATSTHLYTAVKVLGAAYVVWLGVQAVRHRADARLALETGGGDAPTRVAHALRTGFVVGVTNPKTIVFFLAFLPQFTDPSGRVGPQLALLGLLFSAMAVVSDSVWVSVASRARRWFARRPARLDALGATGGSVMVAVGTAMLVRE